MQLTDWIVMLAMGVIGILVAGEKPEIGKEAPDFTLPDHEGKQRRLSDYRGAWVLVYFYPKDDTPGCTVEACSFRDRFPHFEKLRLFILGVSTDDPASHRAFAQKHGLNFRLLSDEEGGVSRLYGVFDDTKKRARRVSFLIDPQGRVAKVYDPVDPETHADEVLEDLRVFMMK